MKTIGHVAENRQNMHIGDWKSFTVATARNPEDVDTIVASPVG